MDLVWPGLHALSLPVLSFCCSGYVIAAWIWSGLFYMLLDPIKWALIWILNEDGYRDEVRGD